MDPDAIDRMVRNMPARSGTTAATRRHLHHHRACTRRPLEDEQKPPALRPGHNQAILKGCNVPERFGMGGDLPHWR
jgi:hypothetical protein